MRLCRRFWKKSTSSRSFEAPAPRPGVSARRSAPVKHRPLMNPRAGPLPCQTTKTCDIRFINFAKLIKRFRVEKARGFRLSDVDPADTCGLDFGKAAAKDILPMVCAILPLCRRSSMPRIDGRS